MNFKNKNYALFLAVSIFTLPLTVFADDPGNAGSSSGSTSVDAGNGRIKFTGSIIEAACSINPESSDQTVDLGQIATHELKGSGSSTPRPFEIKLENCDVSTNNAVDVSFIGNAVDTSNKILGITGTAEGAGITLTDGTGNSIELGKAHSQAIHAGNNSLTFNAQLQGLGDDDAIKTGNFTSVVDFSLVYK